MAHSKISFSENPYFLTHTSVHWKRNYIGVLIVIRHSAKLTIWGLICSLTAEKNLRVYWIQHIIQSSLQTEGSHVNTHWRETVQMSWMREVIQSSLSSEDSFSQSHWGETLCVCTLHTVACVILRKHFSFSSRFTRYSNSLTSFDFEDLQKHYVFGNGELA